jgi:hypothetical protein
MNRLRILRSIGFALLAFVAVAVAQEVRTDYDHHANFSHYHTYYFEKVQASDELWQRRIQDAIDHDLQAKGWQRVDGSADIAVTAVGGIRDQREYQTFYNGMGGWRWRGAWGGTTTEVETYEVGTLVLDLYDAHTKELVWRGTARQTLSDKPEKNEKKLEHAIEKMLNSLPPKE